MCATPVTADGFNSLGLGDATIRSISWEHGGRDLSIVFNHARGHTLAVRFGSVTDLALGIKQGTGDVAPPFLWSAEAAEEPSGCVRVVIDFGGAPEGGIALACQSMEVGPV